MSQRDTNVILLLQTKVSTFKQIALLMLITYKLYYKSHKKGVTVSNHFESFPHLKEEKNSKLKEDDQSPEANRNKLSDYRNRSIMFTNTGEGTTPHHREASSNLKEHRQHAKLFGYHPSEQSQYEKILPLMDSLQTASEDARNNFRQAHQEYIQVNNIFQEACQSLKNIDENTERRKTIWQPVLELRKQVLEARRRAYTASKEEFSSRYKKSATSQTTLDAAKRMLDARRAILDATQTVLDAGQEIHYYTRPSYNIQEQIFSIVLPKRLTATQHVLDTTQSMIDAERRWLDAREQYTRNSSTQQEENTQYEEKKREIGKMQEYFSKTQKWYDEDLNEFNELSENYEKSLQNLDNTDIDHDNALQNINNERQINDRRRYQLTSGTQQPELKQRLSTLLKTLSDEALLNDKDDPYIRIT